MNEREAQSDRQRSKTLRCSGIRSSENDEEEEERQNKLGNQSGHHVVSGRRMLTVAITREPVRE